MGFLLFLSKRKIGKRLEEFNTWKKRYSESFKNIDSTFKIQVRTTLSEGWHEIEHNMRYKYHHPFQFR
ncbi:hypothetical protein DXA15_21945 [Parabacteroides sp. AM58-2XD]|nr:hypothetical protein DXA15_21945 [Parabacteroides sp. AM58-2XD]